MWRRWCWRSSRALVKVFFADDTDICGICIKRPVWVTVQQKTGFGAPQTRFFGMWKIRGDDAAVNRRTALVQSQAQGLIQLLDWFYSTKTAV